MNYSQKRTLIGRIVYIVLTLMAVTILCVTMYTFFASSREPNNPDIPIDGSDSFPTESDDPPISDNKPGNTPVTDDTPVGGTPDDETEGSNTDSHPTVTPPAKDWTKLKVSMPVDGEIVKRHDMVNAVFSVTMNDYRVHQGIDIACDMNADVLSCAYGTVKTVGYDPFMGYTVVIDHGDGLQSCYQNLAEELADDIAVGSTVYAGQKVGLVGESAIIEIADEPHLHFELKLDGKLIDPMTMLEYSASASAEDAAQQDK